MQGKLFLKPKYETFMLPTVATVAVATVILMQIQLPSYNSLVKPEIW